MWWNSNIIKFIVIPSAGLVIIPLIWAIVRKIVKLEGGVFCKYHLYAYNICSAS